MMVSFLFSSSSVAMSWSCTTNENTIAKASMPSAPSAAPAESSRCEPFNARPFSRFSGSEYFQIRFYTHISLIH